MFTKTFSSASSDIADYSSLRSLGASRAGSVSRVLANANSAVGSATLELALVDTDGGTNLCVGRFELAVTPTARRAGSDGASGDYICDVVDAESGKSLSDLLGSGGIRAGDGSRYEWFIGCTDLTTISSLDVWIAEG